MKNKLIWKVDFYIMRKWCRTNILWNVKNKKRGTNLKKQDKRNWPKAAIQILSFLLLTGLFEAQFSAVGTIVSAVYQGTVSWERIRYSVWMLLATVPAVIIVGRFFCGYFCSFGAVQDFLWFAGNKLKSQFRKAGAKNLHSNSKKSGRNVPTGWIKYGVLLFWAVFVWSGMVKWNIAGPWQVFGQYVSFGHWPGLKPLLSVGGILLLVIFIGSLFVQRFFCRYFCPMGAIYSLISQASFLKIDKPRDGCGKCHLCTSKCPMGMDLTKKDRIAGGECISCQKCVSWCPKGNARFRSRYGVLIGVGVTCITIMVSQLFIAGNLAREKMADSVKKTAENNAEGNFQNGIYTGTGEGYRGKVTVTVKVADGKITELVLDDYADDKSYMERAKNRIFQEMISRQNTDVDTVSGATYSSNGLIEAVNKALGNEEGEGKKPEQEESEDKQSFIEAGRFQNLTDGIYTGSADAFRGDVEVQVTVEKQKVTDISILSYCDTEEYFFRAAPAVIEQMKAEQSLNVDAVSGATYSSNGIIHAVANALEIPEDQYAPRPGRNLTAKKKNHGHIVKHEITSQEEYEEKVEKYSK
jgi:uncharacterized protein with FMN-binding domain/Pyruvate/2-oxoacid:ferredoxin oxidoreductase delta subunit